MIPKELVDDYPNSMIPDIQIGLFSASKIASIVLNGIDTWSGWKGYGPTNCNFEFSADGENITYGG